MLLRVVVKTEPSMPLPLRAGIIRGARAWLTTALGCSGGTYTLRPPRGTRTQTHGTHAHAVLTALQSVRTHLGIPQPAQAQLKAVVIFP
jgi:hypothetical protein